MKMHICSCLKTYVKCLNNIAHFTSSIYYKIELYFNINIYYFNLYPHPIHSNNCHFGLFYLTTLNFTGIYAILILTVLSKAAQNLLLSPLGNI